MINTNLPPILHHFWDIAFNRPKIAIFGYASCIEPPSPNRGSICHIIVSDISLKTRSFGLYFCRRKFSKYLNHFYAVRPNATEFREITQNNRGILRRSRSFKDTNFGTNRKPIYDFLIVINISLPPILHRFRDIAVDRPEIAILGYPSCLTPPAEGFPWDNLREIFSGCQWMAKVPKTVEILPKIWTAWVGRTNVTDYY